MVYHIIAQSVCFSEWQPSVDDMDWQAGLSSQKNTASRLACSCFENSSGLPNVYPIETMWTCRLAHTDDKHLFKEPRVHKCLFKRIKLWIIKSLSTVCLLECWQLLYFYENLLVWAHARTHTQCLCRLEGGPRISLNTNKVKISPKISAVTRLHIYTLFTQHTRQQQSKQI